MEISLGVLIGFAGLWVWLLVRAVKSCYSESLPASRTPLSLPRAEEDELRARERELRAWNSPSSHKEGPLSFRRHVQLQKAAEKLSVNVTVIQRFTRKG